MRFSYLQLSLGILASVLIAGCAHSPNMGQSDREAYLQQFVGQSSQLIDQTLDLKRLGYQQFSGPELSAQQLSYVVQRPVAIPLPVAQFPAAGGAVPIPVPVSPSGGYDVNLQCKITFLLKDNIATAVRTTGRTC
ncbi:MULTISPECIES: hypothetical protein [Acinetobacter]|uniref:hypothetical protein n=1 Tax=Acinetobacter TaxID=469 RepID=UPI000C230B54|nr:MULTISPECIES: hypothetical protein [Acinetobacter]MDH5820818.1 hypothetical protein [Acinetobacter pseudolwoffii]MDM1322784.1 hypothetical protein [Acinetobacter pseudolwoffii]MDM1336511.1 hypothetical protein [Acinetobacter pseudolwoffii]PJI35398.1 hypothetical protein CU318_07570 [Acinetobacter pseudolwoffii]